MANKKASVASETINNLEENCTEFLDSIYDGTSGYVNYADGEKEKYEKKDVYLTYGEILYPAVDAIINYAPVTEKDVFLDLGSGIGKVVLQWFFKSPIKTAYGIEAYHSRHEVARAVKKKIKAEMPELFVNGRNFHFHKGNFLDADFDRVSIVFTCSTCFSDELMLSIGEKINKSRSIKRVMSLKPIPNLKKLKLVESMKIECSWDTSTCYIYQ